MDLIRLTKNFGISQIVAPKTFIGKKLSELGLFAKYSVHCFGRKEEEEKVISMDPEYVIEDHDKLIFAGNNKNLEKIAKL